MTHHGTALVYQGVGLLLLGPSGAGKSDAALRLLDRGATLISDDRVILKVEEGLLYASPPPEIEGLLEVRNVGIIPVPFIQRAQIHKIISLKPSSSLERYPEQEPLSLLGVPLPHLSLNPFEVSFVEKVKLFLFGKFSY